MNRFYIILFFLILVLGSFKSPEPDLLYNPKSTLHLLVDSLHRINSASYTVTNTERINGKYMSGTQQINYQQKPFKSLVTFIQPNAGSQLLFSPFENDGEAIYSPNGFPYIDLNLDPLGSLMRRNNHHTVYEIGYQYIIKILENALYQEQCQFTVLENNTNQMTIKVVNPLFVYTNYSVKKGEDIRTIAHKIGVNEYLILEKNSDYSFYDETEEGDIIKIPSTYAKEVLLTIDKQLWVPIKIMAYDELGLFEEYQYQDITLNPSSISLSLKN